MITAKPREELIALGARHPSLAVRALGHTILGLLKTEAPVLAVVGQGLVDEIAAALARLEEAVRDRQVAAVESVDPAATQGDAIEAVKIWRRALVSRAKSAALRGTDVPDGLTTVESGGGIHGLSADAHRLVSIATPLVGRLVDVGVDAGFLDAGVRLVAELDEFNLERERARLGRLPDKVKEMYVQKALVYLGVKQVNLLANSVYPEDGLSRKRFNLDALYPRVRRGPGLVGMAEAGRTGAARGGVRARSGGPRREWTKPELARAGARLRVPGLRAQGQATLRVLECDPDALAIVPPETVGELKELLGRLERAQVDRELMAGEVEAGGGGAGGGGGGGNGGVLAEAKVWRRTLTLRVRAALARGLEAPEELGQMAVRGSDPRAVARDLMRLAAGARERLGVLAGVAVTEEFLQHGEAAAAALEAIDAEAERVRLGRLAKRVRELCEVKGRAYLLLKQIHHLGQSAHAAIAEASDYNFDLLYRGSRRGSGISRMAGAATGA